MEAMLPTQACSLEVRRVLNPFRQISQKGPRICKGAPVNRVACTDSMNRVATYLTPIFSAVRDIVAQKETREPRGRYVRENKRGNGGRLVSTCRCRKCGKPGHNIRTCQLEVETPIDCTRNLFQPT